MTFRPIKRLPISGAQTYVDVLVECVGLKEAQYWDQNIQPEIVKQNRLDAKWRWPAYFEWYSASESLRKRNISLYQIGVPAAAGKKAPLALMLLSEGYNALAGGGKSVFVWYLATAPSQALANLGVHYAKPELLLPAIIDTAIQRSMELGYDGRIGLHAAPNPKDAARHIGLYKSYRDQARLKALAKGEKVDLSVGRRIMASNDGRYFFANEKLAQALSNTLDYLR
jgi:hypothetical protein